MTELVSQLPRELATHVFSYIMPSIGIDEALAIDIKTFVYCKMRLYAFAEIYPFYECKIIANILKLAVENKIIDTHKSRQVWNNYCRNNCCIIDEYTNALNIIRQMIPPGWRVQFMCCALRTVNREVDNEELYGLYEDDDELVVDTDDDAEYDVDVDDDGSVF